jgi:hypothetical protein
MKIVNEYGLDVAYLTIEEALRSGPEWSGLDVDLLRVDHPRPADQALLAAAGFVVRPRLVSWLAPLRDTEQAFLAGLRRSARRNVVHGQRLARDLGTRVVVEHPLTEPALARFLDLYERRIADMPNGVNLARGEQLSMLAQRDSYAGVFINGSDGMLGGCLCWARPDQSVFQLRYAATAAVDQRGDLTRALYMATFQLGRELGLRRMSLGIDPSLYGQVVLPGLYEFKKQLGFTPVPAQLMDPGWGTDTADRFRSLRSLTDPSLLLTYDSSYAGWDGTEGSSRPRSFVLRVLTTRNDVDLAPYRAKFLTDVLATEIVQPVSS